MRDGFSQDSDAQKTSDFEMPELAPQHEHDTIDVNEFIDKE